ncbi:hypothetical protein ACFL3G_07630 [Planctomycetota bacterium]
METKFLLNNSLLNGMTAHAFRLGTVLTQGWFWTRVLGCTVLYRGLSMEAVDFDKVLCVSAIDAESVSPPSYVSHDNDTMYFYVVRRVNKCGDQEYTLAAAVKVVIDGNGDIAEAGPNDIFVVKVGQVEGSKAEFIWFYSSIEQNSEPICFKVYYDNGTGQVDYQNAIATIDYEGRRFYSYETGVLGAGRYLFAIRVEDSAGVDDGSMAQISFELEADNPPVIEILNEATV